MSGVGIQGRITDRRDRQFQPVNGGMGPVEWLPMHYYRYEYARKWLEVKPRSNLLTDPVEIDAIRPHRTRS